MKITLSLLFVFLFSGFLAQETLEPLRYNQQLLNHNKIQKNGNEWFIYFYDTLSITPQPVVDDFSTNKFKPLNAQTTDPNVIDSTWFLLSQSGVNEPWGTKYMLDTTYTAQYDKLPGTNGDSIFLVDNVPNASLMVDVADLTQWPIIVTATEVWPAVNSADSLWTVGIDTNFIVPDADADLLQDSVQIFFVYPTAADLNYVWADHFAYRNNSYPILPPTIGVATMDGLDETGYPYDFNVGTYGEADYLTSVHFQLGSFNPSDGIELRFFYQGGGLGNAPEGQDSLVVEFWSPLDNDWLWAWSTPGAVAIDTFELARIPINAVKFLQDGFRFRYKNYGALNGSLDQWHIDYVILEQNFNNDTTPADLAMVYESHGLLKEYTSMPWKHYEVMTSSAMTDTISALIYNTDNVDKILNATAGSSQCVTQVFHNGNLQMTSSFEAGPPNDNVLADGFVNMEFDIGQAPISYAFDETLEDTCALFEVKIALNTSGQDDLKENDTLYYNQWFSNYYSYDDGTAEAAYGITGNQPKLAYRFTAPIEDSLRAIQIHFEPSVNDASNEPFYLTIWDNAGTGGAPGNIIYEEPVLYKPEYNAGPNGFFEYALSQKVAVNGSYYVGWRQTTSDRLNVGFDKNIDHHEKIYFNVLGTWQSTNFDGCLMIRPVYAYDKDDIVGLEEPVSLESVVYPNPTSGQFIVKLDQTGVYEAELFDLNGRLLQSKSFAQQATWDLSDFETGVYVLKIRDNLGNFTTAKVLKQ